MCWPLSSPLALVPETASGEEGPKHVQTNRRRVVGLAGAPVPPTNDALGRGRGLMGLGVREGIASGGRQ